MDVLILGSGTSAGVPMIGCYCKACSSTDPRDQRTRASAVISYNDTRVLIDVTPELRLQCVANRVDWIDSVVLTHAHADHLMGMDDLRRFNAIRKGPLDVWMDELTSQTVLNCFGYCFNRNPDPLMFRPQLVERRIDGKFDLAGVPWTPIPLYHGKAMILGFRIGDVAYCTDASGIPDASWPLLEGLKLLVIDALQPVKHPTHLTIDEALAVVERVRPRRTLFTHMSHNVVHEQIDPTLPDGVSLAYDGQRIDVP
jgi:phosphoribosyl 1,2-cyclic phosphate phosphodiesterase